jgi:hypothetical protein
MMNTETERPAPLQHTFTLTVAVDPFWVEYLTQNVDIFNRKYAGYWAYGAVLDPELGWLVCDTVAADEVPSDADCDLAEARWRAGEPLPAHWYRLGRSAALRAWEEGVKRWGVDWYDHTDAEREDVVVQLALLGEVRYG